MSIIPGICVWMTTASIQNRKCFHTNRTAKNTQRHRNRKEISIYSQMIININIPIHRLLVATMGLATTGKACQQMNTKLPKDLMVTEPLTLHTTGTGAALRNNQAERLRLLMITPIEKIKTKTTPNMWKIMFREIIAKILLVIQRAEEVESLA